MSFLKLVLIAVGLSMDAFAMAICKGISVEKLKKKHMIITGLWFGGAQVLAPILGYLLGTSFQPWIESVGHWFTLAILSIIGVNMIRESREECEKLNASFSIKAMLPLAISDSIDALATGAAFAFMNVNIVLAVLLIGVITFVFSAIGVKIGNRLGEKYKSKAEVIGGIILIAMGVSSLWKHTGV